MKNLLTTLVLLFTTNIFAQSDGARVLTGSAQPPLPFNVLPQPGFENRTTGWSVTSGTFTTTQATANVARGRFSASWTVPTSTSSGIFFQSDEITLPAGLYGRQCLVNILSKGNALTNGAMVIEAYDGTTAYGTSAMPNAVNYTKTQSQIFTCPTSGTLRLRIRTTTSTTASPTPVYFDEAYLGDADSFGNGGIFFVTSTVTATAASTLPFGAAPRQLVYVQGSGAVTLSVTTPLTAGAVDGQELYLVGRSDTNTVTVPNSGNVVLKGSTGVVLGLNDVLALEWDATNLVWIQEGSTEFDASQITRGIIDVARGGTGIASGTSGGILGFTASGTIASSGALTANQIVLGGGAGVLPSSLGSLGTSSTLLHGNAGGAPSFSTVVNADVDAAAAIAYSKLNLTGSILNADVNASAAIAYSKLNLSGSIVNADINASAGIVDSKLATISTALKVSNSATTATSANTNSAIVARDGSGNFTATTITAALTGAASGNTTYTPNNHGAVVSGAANVMSVIAPDASTAKFFKSAGASSDPVWAQVTLTTDVTGALPIANGGTGQATKAAGFDALSPMSASGDMIYGGTSGTGTRLAKGSDGQILSLVAGLPAWANAAAAPAIYAPINNVYVAGATWNPHYIFAISSGSATVGATYTNNAVTFTVYATVASATVVILSGNGTPTSSGTLTKSAGTGDATLTFSAVAAPIALDAACVASGGGGAGAGTTTAGQTSGGSGGGAGGYARAIIRSGFGTSQTVTIGAAGLAGTAGSGGGNGNTSSFGSLVVAAGGTGGTASAASANARIAAGAGGGGASVGDILVTGGAGGSCIGTAGGVITGGTGGAGFFGGGGAASVASTGASAGSAGVAYGSGGGGAANGTTGNSGVSGGAGAGGACSVIEEYQ